MKIHIVLDYLDYEKNYEIAHILKNEVDAFVVSNILLVRYGIEVLEKLRKEIPEKIVYVDTKIVDRPRELVGLFSQYGADWVSVMAGARQEITHAAASKAHDVGKKIILDLLDTQHPGQEALQAASLGIDAILFTAVSKNGEDPHFVEQWQMVQGNTELPVYFACNATTDMIPVLQEIQPAVVVIGKTITDAFDPLQALKGLKESLKKME